MPDRIGSAAPRGGHALAGVALDRHRRGAGAPAGGPGAHLRRPPARRAPPPTGWPTLWRCGRCCPLATAAQPPGRPGPGRRRGQDPGPGRDRRGHHRAPDERPLTTVVEVVPVRGYPRAAERVTGLLAAQVVLRPGRERPGRRGPGPGRAPSRRLQLEAGAGPRRRRHRARRGGGGAVHPVRHHGGQPGGHPGRHRLRVPARLPGGGAPHPLGAGPGRRGDPTGRCWATCGPSSSGWATSPPRPATSTSTCSTSRTSRGGRARRDPAATWLRCARSWSIASAGPTHELVAALDSPRYAAPGRRAGRVAGRPAGRTRRHRPGRGAPGRPTGAGGGRRADLEDLPAPGPRRSAHHRRLPALRACTTCARTPRSSATPSSASAACSTPTRSRLGGQGAQGGAGRARAPSRTARCRRRRWPGCGEELIDERGASQAATLIAMGALVDQLDDREATARAAFAERFARFDDHRGAEPASGACSPPTTTGAEA